MRRERSHDGADARASGRSGGDPRLHRRVAEQTALGIGAGLLVQQVELAFRVGAGMAVNLSTPRRGRGRAERVRFPCAEERSCRTVEIEEERLVRADVPSLVRYPLTCAGASCKRKERGRPSGKKESSRN